MIKIIRQKKLDNLLHKEFIRGRDHGTQQTVSLILTKEKLFSDPVEISGKAHICNCAFFNGLTIIPHKENPKHE